jgi:hypothetical protein
LPKWGSRGSGGIKENNYKGLWEPVNLKDCEKKKFLHGLIIQKETISVIKKSIQWQERYTNRYLFNLFKLFNQKTI